MCCMPHLFVVLQSVQKRQGVTEDGRSELQSTAALDSHCEWPLLTRTALQ